MKASEICLPQKNMKGIRIFYKKKCPVLEDEAT